MFVTVGTQGAFDRLVRTVDEWAGRRAKSGVFAQIGPSDYRPEHIAATRFLDPAEFRTRIEAARIVVAHAGMGTIITALERGKPIIVMPRRADLREQRNDHQLSTAKHFAQQGRIVVAFNEQELCEKLDLADTLSTVEPLSARASPPLLATIRAFLEGKPYTLDTVVAADNSGKSNTGGSG
jgi:UDP-N-acetylglucosamine transferase subunit ALG13